MTEQQPISTHLLSPQEAESLTNTKAWSALYHGMCEAWHILGGNTEDEKQIISAITDGMLDSLKLAMVYVQTAKGDKHD